MLSLAFSSPVQMDRESEVRGQMGGREGSMCMSWSELALRERNRKLGALTQIVLHISPRFLANPASQDVSQCVALCDCLQNYKSVLQFG